MNNPLLGTKPQINFPWLQTRPVADIRMPAAEGGGNKCVLICGAMKTQPREVDLGLRVFNQSAARTHTDISCKRTEPPTPFPLATRGDSSWRFRQTARGARGRASGELALRDSPAPAPQAPCPHLVSAYFAPGFIKNCRELIESPTDPAAPTGIPLRVRVLLCVYTPDMAD